MAVPQAKGKKGLALSGKRITSTQRIDKAITKPRKGTFASGTRDSVMPRMSRLDQAQRKQRKKA